MATLQDILNSIKTSGTNIVGGAKSLYDNPSKLFFARPSPFLKQFTTDEQINKIGSSGGKRALGMSFLDFLASPKDKGYGSFMPYAFQSLVRTGIPTAQGYYDQYDKSIMDSLNYSKLVQDLELDKYKALPENYRNYQLMQGDPNFNQYQFLKDIGTGDMKEFLFSQKNADITIK